MKFLIIIISIITLFFSFQAPAMAQEEYTIDHQIEIFELKVEIVRLKKGVFLEKVQHSMFFIQLRIEEARLVDEIEKLTELKVKQEAEKKAGEEKNK